MVKASYSKKLFEEEPARRVKQALGRSSFQI